MPKSRSRGTSLARHGILSLSVGTPPAEQRRTRAGSRATQPGRVGAFGPGLWRGILPGIFAKFSCRFS